KFCQQLCYGFLSLIRTRLGGSESFLHREPADGLKASPKPSDAPLLFDSRGGAFTHDPTTRRALFRWRSAFGRSLSDLSMKDKREVVEGHLNAHWDSLTRDSDANA